MTSETRLRSVLKPHEDFDDEAGDDDDDDDDDDVFSQSTRPVLDSVCDADILASVTSRSVQ